MIQLFQVGVGSGGMVVLDLLCRDERVRKITLIDPDVYQPHNVHRHYFPAAHPAKTHRHPPLPFGRARVVRRAGTTLHSTPPIYHETSSLTTPSHNKVVYIPSPPTTQGYKLRQPNLRRPDVSPWSAPKWLSSPGVIQKHIGSLRGKKCDSGRWEVKD